MNILLNGICGHMGREVEKLCHEGYRGARLACGVDINAADEGKIAVYTGFDKIPSADGIDCIVDFSHHTCTPALLAYATANSLPCVLATTGHTEEEIRAIYAAAESIPVFFSANMSLGVALLVELAKTAAQSTAYYTEYFEKLSADGGAVIHFSISDSMSSAHNFARIAAEDMENVYVVDSQNLSTGIALLVLKAADLVAEGKEAKEIYDEICALRSRVDASFVIDTLEYLHKGGRCSAVAMLGANVLKLRPCIEVKEGAMGVSRKYRGKMSLVYKEYAKDQLHDPDDIDLTRVFVTHTCGDDPVVDEIVELVKQTLPFKEVIKGTAGCTISAHCGPGTLGVLFFRKSDKK